MSILRVSSSPHIRTNDDTQTIMLDVIIALMPALIAGGYFFGYRAMVITIITVISSVIFEHLWALVFKKPTTINDYSAVVSGMLLAFNLPVTVPLWLPVVGSFFMIIIIKMCFGGLGRNFLNPALAARAFLLAVWPTAMTTWVDIAPKLNLFSNPDVVSTATPLALIKGGVHIGADLPSYLNLFFGGVGGCIGETSVLALLIGGIYLLYRKVITLRIPLAFIASVGVFTYIFGGSTLFTGDYIYHILAGGLILGAFYMATDYTSSPVTPMGQIYFGIGCGVFTSIIRLWGIYPEGVSYAILLMNIATPLIDKLTPPKRFGDDAKTIRDYIKIGAILLIITLTFALAIGANSFTKNKTAQNSQIDEVQDSNTIMHTPSGKTSVDKISEHTLANGEKEYSVSCKPFGYAGAISMTVNLDNSLNVTGVEITNIKDTPGLGARAKEPSFYEQFIGKKEGVSVTKDTPTDNQIKAISGATITSKAVAQGINDAIAEVKSIAQPPKAISEPTPTVAPTPSEKPTPTVAPNQPAKDTTTSLSPSGRTSVYKISQTLLSSGVKSYSVYCKTNGYESEISMIVGLDSSLNITGVNITSINDTPGRGARAKEPSFLSQFIGKNGSVSVTRGTPTGNQIQAISGATITSKAVAKGVNDAIAEIKLQ